MFLKLGVGCYAGLGDRLWISDRTFQISYWGSDKEGELRLVTSSATGTLGAKDRLKPGQRAGGRTETGRPRDEETEIRVSRGRSPSLFSTKFLASGVRVLFPWAVLCT